MSRVKWVFGAGKCTISPSNISSKSYQGVNVGDQRKSFKNIHSASSTPTHANVPDAGFTKVLKMTVSGFKMKVFPQFAGPTIIRLRCFPRPIVSKSTTACRNFALSMLLFFRISFAHSSHAPLHPATHWPFDASRMREISYLLQVQVLVPRVGQIELQVTMEEIKLPKKERGLGLSTLCVWQIDYQ